MQIPHPRILGTMHQTRVPPIHVLHATVLRGDLGHDGQESDDGLGVRDDLELSVDVGFEPRVAFGTEFGGDDELRTPGGAADEVQGSGFGRRDAGCNA